MVSLVNTVRDIDRLRQILIVLGRHGFGEVAERTGLARLVRRPDDESVDLGEGSDRARKTSVGERLRRVFEDLGPSFVKLGQILSTRSDLLPKDVVEELARLQDRVAPVSFDLMRTEVESELGAPLEEVFESFEEAPLASASIAQVHRARLKDGDASVEVVAKIQRPNIRNTIERDIELLYLLARAIERSIPEARIYSPTGLVSEFDRAMTTELDFGREADHIERLERTFADNDKARFPTVYRSASGRRVLTMEFLDGLKLDEALKAGYSGPQLARNTLAVLFQQIFEDGFFHGDPHPGNLLIMGDKDDPVVAMIDLGLVGRLSPQLRDKTVDLMLAAARQDSAGVADALYAIGRPTKRIDRNRYEAEVTFLADRYLGKPLNQIQMSLLIRDIIQGAIQFGLEIPSEFMMLGRTLMTVEGVGKTMFPELDIFEEIRPFFTRVVKDRYSPERITHSLLRTAARFGDRAHHLPDVMEDFMGDLARGQLLINAPDPGLPRASDLLGRRIFSGFTVASLIGGGSILVAFEKGGLAGWVMLGTAAAWALGHVVRGALAYRRMLKS